MKSHKSSIYSFFFGFQFLNKFKFQPKKKVCNFADFSFLSDPGRIQTCNPQSRNLIFYSVELRGRLMDCKCKNCLEFYSIKLMDSDTYIKFFRTNVEMVFPSAFPANSLLSIPITFPISFIPLAPNFSIVATTIFSMASADKASGKN